MVTGLHSLVEDEKLENTNSVLLEFRKIRKEFPGVVAVNDVSFDIRKGEVHIVIGENGAGKSTLVKMVSGVYPIDGGEMYLDGERYIPENVMDAQAHGINMIHQELNMMANRTVAQNVFIGREPKKGLLVDEHKMNADCKALLDSIEIDISPTTMVRDLSIAQQQMVEVAKALSTENKLLIMDEPTSSLTQKEIDELFRITRKLKSEGVAIVYISHRMQELLEIGDRVTVMRDGYYVDTCDVKNITLDDLIPMMVGRKIENVYNREYNEPRQEVLRAEDLEGYRFRHVNFRACAGEIVGFAGLVGAGRTELVKALFGYDPILSGKVYLNGREVRTKGHCPAKAVRSGMALLPEDRKTEGLLLDMPIKENIAIANLRNMFKSGLVRTGSINQLAEQSVKKLRIMTTSIEKKVYLLSGGNQQKVVVAKWLATKCGLIIFDEPTRGIDVGAKAEIYSIMNDLAKAGNAIIMISSDLPELLGVADRVYVMKDGEITGEVPHTDTEKFCQEYILSLALEGRKD